MIKKLFVCLALCLCVSVPFASICNAVTKTPKEINDELCLANPNSAACNPDNDLTTMIGTIVNVLLFALGATCALVIIVGGIRFVTSGGDASAVTNAKNSILYGVIGLLIAFSAYAVVGFVIDKFK